MSTAGVLSERQKNELYVYTITCYQRHTVLLLLHFGFRHKSMLEYLFSAGLTKTYEQLRQEDSNLVGVRCRFSYLSKANLFEDKFRSRSRRQIEWSFGQEVDECYKNAEEGGYIPTPSLL